MAKKSKKKFQKPRPEQSASRKVNVATTPSNVEGYLLAGLVFLLPMIFSRATLDPTIVPRHLLISFFVAAVALLFYVFKKKDIPASMSKSIYAVFIIGLAHAAWSIVSTAASINPANGYFEICRLLLNLALLFLVLQMVYKKESTVVLVCKTIAITAIIHSFIGLVQNFDLGFADLPGANSKPWGLNANRNLYGSALAFSIPFVGYLFYRSGKLWKAIASFSLFISATAIVISQTRSAWVSMAAFLLVLLLLSIIFIRTETKKILKFTAVFFISALAVASIIIAADSKGTLATELKERGSSLVRPTADRTTSDYSINDRFSIWKKTTELIKDKPVTGVGTGNWKISILAYGGTGTAWAGGSYVPDRVHNIYLQMLAENGVPGLLLFLAFWLSIGWIGFKLLRGAAAAQKKVLVAFMMAGLAAVATDGIFSFPTERIEHSLYIIVMAGFIIGTYASELEITHRKTASKTLIYIVVLIAILNIFIGLKRKQFEENIYQVKALEKLSRPADLIVYADKGKNSFYNLDPDGLAIEAKEAIAHRDLKDYDKAISTMKQALKYNPNSAMALNNMGTIYTQMGKFKEAIPYLEKALKLTPDFDMVKKNLAINYYNDKQLEKAISTLESFDYKSEAMFLELYNNSKAYLEYQKNNPGK